MTVFAVLLSLALLQQALSQTHKLQDLVLPRQLLSVLGREGVSGVGRRFSGVRRGGLVYWGEGVAGAKLRGALTLKGLEALKLLPKLYLADMAPVPLNAGPL